MGRFSTTLHLHNGDNLTKAQYTKAFCDMMKNRGYRKSDEENAELSYTLVFSANRKWVTLLTEDEQDVKSSASELSKAFGTEVVCVEIVDSDFAMLGLFDSTGNHVDMLTLGDASGYMDDAPMGTKEIWQPLLTDGCTWEQVNTIQSNSHVFAEEALSDFAPLIGMDAENILLDCDNATNDKNTVILHFKMAKENKLTLNAAFKQVFGEALEPLGYKLIKGKKMPIYVRAVSDEIVHIISISKARSDRTDEFAFDIVGDPVTTYWDWLKMVIELGNDDFEPNWDIYRQLIYRKKDAVIDFELMDKLSSFSYKKNNKESLLNAMKYALEMTNQFLLPEISEVTDMNAYIKYYYIFHPVYLNLSHAYDESTGEINNENTDSLIIIKANYRDDGLWNVLEKCEAYSKRLRRSYDGFDPAKYQKEYDKRNKYRLEQIALRDKIYSNQKLCLLISEILDDMKESNIEWLRQKGIDI